MRQHVHHEEGGKVSGSVAATRMNPADGILQYVDGRSEIFGLKMWQNGK